LILFRFYILLRTEEKAMNSIVRQQSLESLTQIIAEVRADEPQPTPGNRTVLHP
jgi:hypothetical protein